MQMNKVLFVQPRKMPSLILLIQNRESKVAPAHSTKAYRGEQRYNSTNSEP